MAMSSHSRSEIGGGATYSAVKRADERRMAREKTAARRNSIVPVCVLDWFVGWIGALYGGLNERASAISSTRRAYAVDE